MKPTAPQRSRPWPPCPTPGPSPSYLKALDHHDPEVRQAGEDALRALRDSVGAELESHVRSGQCSRPAALAIERILARFRPVTEWTLIGPFPMNAPPMFTDPASIDFSPWWPRSCREGRAMTWTPRRGDPATGRVILDDLKHGEADFGSSGYDPNESPDLMAFAYTEVVADQDRPALFKVGSSGTITVSANGSFAFNSDHQSGRAYRPDSDTFRLTLKKGINRIVIRTRQGIGAWSFSLQVSNQYDASSAPGIGSTSRDELRDYALKNPGNAKQGQAAFLRPPAGSDA